MFKILTAGDLHIGKKSSSVHGSGPEKATKYTWEKMVDYAIDNKVDYIALPGDIIDQDNKFFAAIGTLQEGFTKLENAEIPVLIIAGNHDFDVLPQAVSSKNFSNIHLLGKKGTWESITLEKNGKKIQFLGWSFPTQHYRENPFTDFSNAEIDNSIPVVGLMHGDVGSIDSSYAPMNKSDFINTDADIWLLGHIHKPEVLNERSPLVFYTGSPHAMSAKESGEHGPVLLTINSKTDIQTERILLSPIRYETLSIDISSAEDKEGLRSIMTVAIEKAVQSIETTLDHTLHLIYDLILTGEHAHISEIKNWTEGIEDYQQNIQNTNISVRKVSLKLTPKVENLEELATAPTSVGVLAKTILALQKGETTEFSQRLSELWEKRREKLEGVSTYQAVRTAYRVELPKQEDAHRFLLDECNRILGELINQQEEHGL